MLQTRKCMGRSSRESFNTQQKQSIGQTIPFTNPPLKNLSVAVAVRNHPAQSQIHVCFSLPFPQKAEESCSKAGSRLPHGSKVEFCHSKNKRQLPGCCCFEGGKGWVENWDGLQVGSSSVTAAERGRNADPPPSAWITKALVKSLCINLPTLPSMWSSHSS